MAFQIDLDEEDWRVRGATGVSPISTQQEIFKEPAPLGLSGVSSLRASDAEERIPQHRPALAEPRQNVMLKVLAAHQEFERLTNRSAKVFKLETENSLSEMSRLEKEKEEALIKEAEAAANRDTWETVSQIGQYVAGAAAIAVGGAVGGVPGAILIASGVVGVGNRVIHDTNLLQAAVGWYTESEKLQKTLTQRIEMGMFFLQMGLGLAGGVTAWQAGAFAGANAVGIVSGAESTIGTASSIASAGAKVGSNIYNKRVADYQADKIEIDGNLTAQSHAITQQTMDISRVLEENDALVRELQKMIRNQQVSMN